MPFKKVECPSKSLLGVANTLVCWNQTWQCNLCNSWSPEWTSQAGAVNHKSTPSLIRCSPNLPGKFSLPNTTWALLPVSAALYLESLHGMENPHSQGEGVLQPQYPSGLSATAPAWGGLYLSMTPLLLPVSTWLFQCFLGILFLISYISLGFSSWLHWSLARSKGMQPPAIWQPFFFSLANSRPFLWFLLKFT